MQSVFVRLSVCKVKTMVQKRYFCASWSIVPPITDNISISLLFRSFSRSSRLVSQFRHLLRRHHFGETIPPDQNASPGPRLRGLHQQFLNCSRSWGIERRRRVGNGRRMGIWRWRRVPSLSLHDLWSSASSSQRRLDDDVERRFCRLSESAGTMNWTLNNRPEGRICRLQLW